MRMFIITARCSYASMVLGVVILSVCLSHVCFVTNPMNLPAIFLYHILITANMQSKTSFPSSHQLKSYIAPKSRLSCQRMLAFVFMFLFTCTGHTVGCRNIVSGSKYLFSHKVGPFWGYIKIVNNFVYLLQTYLKFPLPSSSKLVVNLRLDSYSQHFWFCGIVFGVTKPKKTFLIARV